VHETWEGVVHQGDVREIFRECRQSGAPGSCH